MFKKMVLPTILVSGVIFAGFFTLLAEYGSGKIEIEVDNQEFFNGEVRDVLSPGMGAALILTLGVAGILVTGYAKSLDRKEKLEKQLLSTQKAISQKDFQIQKFIKSEKINNPKIVYFRRR